MWQEVANVEMSSLDGLEGPVVVRMIGEFDASNADDLRAKLLSLDPARAVVLDLAETTFIDSTVLAVVAAMFQRGIPVSVTNAQPIVARVLQVSGVAQLLA